MQAIVVGLFVVAVLKDLSDPKTLLGYHICNREPLTSSHVGGRG